MLAAHEGTVDKVVCGHLHRPISSVVAGVPVQVGISTVQHVALDFEAGAGPSLIHDPIGYQIHRISNVPDGGRVVTHAWFIETGEWPFTPSWAPDYDPTTLY